MMDSIEAPAISGSSSRMPPLHALHALAPSCAYDGKRLARMFNISPRQLQRMFSANFSRSPQAWLNEQRLLVAREMLKTAASVKEVAYALGFRRTSQFSRDFRRMFGVTPSEACMRTCAAHAPAGSSNQNLGGAMRSERHSGQRLGGL